MDRIAQAAGTTRGSAAKERRRGAASAGPGKYVYCIIESRKAASFGNIGIGGREDPVYTIQHEDLTAVVSDTPVAIYDPTRENVLNHERVIEKVMERHSVLPMSFGTVFRTKDDVVEFLKDTHEALREVLAQVRGKIEFGVQVNWDRDAVVRDIEAQSEEVARLKAQIQRTGSGSTYFARVQLGRLIEAHAGMIWVESEVARGTTVHFTVPFAEVDAQRATPLSALTPATPAAAPASPAATASRANHDARSRRRR